MLEIDDAIGMLVTENELQARRALNFLLGRFGTKALGWFYKEGFYNIVIIGRAEDYAGGEQYFHHLKKVLDTWISADVMPSSLPVECFQEVSL
jgi:hypothetical protein